MATFTRLVDEAGVNLDDLILLIDNDARTILQSSVEQLGRNGAREELFGGYDADVACGACCGGHAKCDLQLIAR